jgi:cation diffusion facilitator CzcD-associated flavoprotein CzcO
MYTLGFSFRPWQRDTAIDDRRGILDYVRDIAQVLDIDKTMLFEYKVTGADWGSSRACWTVQGEYTIRAGTPIHMLAFSSTWGFLHRCSGYHDYRAGHEPHWPGMAQFAGQIVHPQRWAAGLGYTNRRVVVIGSGPLR